MKVSKLIILVVLALITSCWNSRTHDVPVLIFYYDLIDFNTDEKAERIRDILISEFNTSNYIITPDEVLKTVPKESAFQASDLEKFHPYIHQIMIFQNDATYKDKDCRFKITYQGFVTSGIVEVHFEKFIYNSKTGWKLLMDYGSIPLQTNNRGTTAKEAEFIGLEFARESFR